MTVENYHLKWDSHHTHLNSSVATLYKNEKYADVVLYSSNSITTNNNTSNIPTVGISAHKFILSSCSQYFSTIFETSPVTNHGVFYIVLPPDLSHRAIQILVQYMYMGEATVSNDILSEVLRGGEILKIRGLCRASATTTAGTTAIPTAAATTAASASGAASVINNAVVNNVSGNSLALYNSTLPRMCLNGGSTSVRYLIEQQQQQHMRGLGASVLPKDSPVIIKSPKPLSLLTTNAANVATKNTTSKINSSSIVGGGGVNVSLGVGGITINKNVAIDPEDKCCYSVDNVTVAKSTLLDNSSICNEIGCSSCPLSIDAQQQQSHHSRHIQHTTRERCPNDEPLQLTCPIRRNSYETSHSHNMNDYEHEQELSRINQSQECPPDNTHDYPPLTDNYKMVANAPQQQQQSIDNMSQRSETPLLGKFTNIKQEPREWLSSPSTPPPATNQIIRTATGQSNSIALQQSVLDFQLNDIKTETVLNPVTIVSSSPSASTTSTAFTGNPDDILPSSTLTLQSQSQAHSQSHSDYDRYVSCEMCNEQFDDATSLGQHSDANHHATTTSGCSTGCNLTINSNGNINNKNPSNNLNENNALSKPYVPKKRRRISESNIAEPVSLQCDLCNTTFETAGEWVRHMNCQHTEIELAIFNSKKDKEYKTSSGIINASNNNSKKLGNNRQVHQHQRTQLRTTTGNSRSTNTINTSAICSSPAPALPLTSVTTSLSSASPRNETINDFVRPTLSPA